MTGPWVVWPPHDKTNEAFWPLQGPRGWFGHSHWQTL
jgi:hypothetical protein